MKTPSCYNREPFTDPNAGWVETGRRKTVGWFLLRADKWVPGPFKPIMRYRWPWFTDRCAAWDGPDVSETVPAREGWQCDGCKHLPAHARAWIRGEDGCD